MSFIANDIELNKKLKDKVIESAASSLTAFAVKFEDGSGLLVEVSGKPESVTLETKIMLADELPSIGDAVCKVEWAWIHASKIESIQTVVGSIKFNLQPVGPLTVQAQIWNGAPFISFMPYKGS